MLIAILFTHRRANDLIRERIYKFWEKKVEEEIEGVKERVLVPTCYRVEFYLRIEDESKDKVIKELIPPDLNKYAEILESPSDIFEHLVMVGSGADSPAIGEPEVFGQLKSAYKKALRKNWVSGFLTKAFERAINVAKKIREETELQSRSISIPRIVSLYLKDVSKEKKELSCLLVGTGEMGIAISRYLRQEKIPFVIATRNEERANFLKKHAKLETVIYTPETLPLYVGHFDAVIFATEANGYLLKKEHIERKGKPKLIIDLGFPNNVDPRIKEIRGIEFHQIDEFKKIIEERVKEKEREINYVKFRAKKESIKFEKWIKKEEEILKLFNFVDKKVQEIIKDDEIEKEKLERLKRFFLFPVLKSLRSEKDIEEIIEKWIK